jgi:hypothetical protein
MDAGPDLMVGLKPGAGTQTILDTGLPSSAIIPTGMQKRQASPLKPARSNVIDLVAALQESLAQKKPRKRGVA